MIISLLQKLPHRLKPAGTGRLTWLTGAVLIGGVAAVAQGSLESFKTSETEAWRYRLDQIAQATAQTSADTFAAPARLLNNIADEVQTAPLQESAFTRRIADEMRGLPGIDATFVIGADGALLASGGFMANDAIARKNIVARYALEQKNSSGLHIGAPFRLPDGKRVYLMSRILRGQQDQALGAVILVLPLAQLITRLGKGMPDDGPEVLLYRADHIPLAAWPDTGSAIPASRTRPSDDIAVLRPVEGYPALVQVSAADNVVLRKWRQAVRATEATALCGVAALLIAIGLLHRTRRQRDSEMEKVTELERRADQAAQEKSRFLSFMRHEIRTPMNGILGMAELLLESRLNHQQRQYASVVQESGKALLKIMDDLIDGSFREAGAAFSPAEPARSAVPAGKAAAPLETVVPEVDAPARARVLVAEDSEVNRQLIQILLTRMGCDPLFVENGQEALYTLMHENVDLVLMDCMMPVMDGYEAIRRLREQEARTGAHRLPVIALTANSTGEEKTQCLAAGMDDHLAKPFTGAAFTALVSRWLAKAEGMPTYSAAVKKP